MSIGRKLSRLSSVGPASKPAEPAREAETRAEARTGLDDDGWGAFRSALRSKSDREARRPETRSAPMPLPGERMDTPLGPLRTIRTESPLDAAHGGVTHRALFEIDRSAIARFLLDAELEGVDPSRLVFLDTETTGLAGGAGTVPFLIGVARIEGPTMLVEQWLLERFGEEAPILGRLAEVLESASGLVTYNGKSFDWPLLRARYVMHRMRLPGVPKHLDLVHGARRYFGSRLPSVRLVDVERELLDFEREDDIDSAAIPQIFLDFQRTGSHPELARVVRHHAFDLAALPAILVRFARIFAGEERPAFSEDRLACAKVVARSGFDDASRSLACSLLEDERGAIAAHGSLVLARQARRAGDLDAERCALERAVDEASDDDVRFVALVTLAKFLEHRGKDIAAALEVSRRAHRIAADESTERRIARLERKNGARVADLDLRE